MDTSSPIRGQEGGNAEGDLGAFEFDTDRRFVHITKRHGNGLVQFDFSVGTPDFSVELMMPETAFDEFCIRQKAVFVHDEVKQVWVKENDD